LKFPALLRHQKKISHCFIQQSVIKKFAEKDDKEVECDKFSIAGNWWNLTISDNNFGNRKYSFLTTVRAGIMGQISILTHDCSIIERFWAN
jgi:hypothetical protein